MSKRRQFFKKLAAWSGGIAAGARSALPQAPNAPFEAPGLDKLPWKMVDGVKEFHLVAEPVRYELLPGRSIDVWGYNGSSPGPTIEVTQGDRVRILFENKLPEMTTVHWHGLELPIEMDGVPGVSQDPVKPGETFTYEFTLHQHGTFFYHSHMAMQQMFGMIGWFIIHPAETYLPAVDRDCGYILQEYALLPNNTVPNTLAMEFNWLTMNGKAGPAVTPVLCRQGERVRLRFVNLGMDHHPMHLHGYQWQVTGTEGGRVPQAAWTDANTTLVGVAQARMVEFVAKTVGDWMLHCHLPHHGMNQMVSMVGPMSHSTSGMHAGGSMEAGMGMMHGAALSDENGPALGRDIGHGTEPERPTTTMIGGDAHAHHHEAYVPDPKSVPGYPQDMWMPMDEMFATPENHGMRAGWTAATMGMMTYVRVLTDEQFDHIAELQRQERGDA